MVGKEEVEEFSTDNALSEGTGETGPLKRKGNFGTRPHPYPMKVYFIQSGAAIKIGLSRNPKSRLGMLQVGVAEPMTLLGVIDGSKEAERRLHSQFADLHMRGEWFRADRPLLDFIEQHAEAYVPPRLPPEPKPEPLVICPPRPALSAGAKATIRSLLVLRDAHGHNTPQGHICSNMVALIHAQHAETNEGAKARQVAELGRQRNALAKLMN